MVESMLLTVPAVWNNEKQESLFVIQKVHQWVFLGIDRNSKYEKAGTTPIVDPAHTCRFTQSYSSWSCSPAEPHYASDCMAKVYKLFEYSE